MTLPDTDDMTRRRAHVTTRNPDPDVRARPSACPACERDAGARLALDRRRFLIGGATLVGGLALAPRASARVRVLGSARPGEGKRNIVLLQLSGGNDALSMVVPYGDDAYHRARDTIRVAAADVLRIDDYVGLHPELKSLRALYDQGDLAIVEGCGYPDPVRSHFKSMEIWHTANHTGRHSGGGWIGRMAETVWRDDPTVELVVHVGSTAPYSLYSTIRPPIAFTTPTGYRWAGATDGDVDAYRDAAEPAPADGSVVARLRSLMLDADRSSRRIRRAAATYRPRVDYPDDDLAASLRAVAAMMDSNLGARVYSVETGGFDTHENQRGKHDQLMRRLDDCLGAFFADLHGRSCAGDTLMVVFSEFGRRLKENGSKGTDHGVAAPMLVLGPSVKGGLYGRHPSLTKLDDGDLIHTTDFRSVYGTVIERWFGEDAQAVLGREYPTLGFA
jgi:uncharacterized protein (DUF1501 family)